MMHSVLLRFGILALVLVAGTIGAYFIFVPSAFAALCDSGDAGCEPKACYSRDPANPRGCDYWCGDGEVYPADREACDPSVSGQGNCKSDCTGWNDPPPPPPGAYACRSSTNTCEIGGDTGVSCDPTEAVPCNNQWRWKNIVVTSNVSELPGAYWTLSCPAGVYTCNGQGGSGAGPWSPSGAVAGLGDYYVDAGAYGPYSLLRVDGSANPTAADIGPPGSVQTIMWNLVYEPTNGPVVDLRCNGSTGPCTVLSGTNVTLSWTSANVANCTASGGWSGAKGLSGSEQQGPITSPVTYVLTCDGVSDSVLVSPGTPTTVDLKCNNGTGLPYTDGPCSPPPGNFELQWTSTNADTCTASRNPPATNWEGSVALTGTKLLSVPGGLRVYALTCTGASTAVDYVTVNPGVNDAKFISQSVPKTVLTTGETMNVSVTMQNCRPNNDCTGLSTWMDTANHRLGSQNPQDNSTWGLARVVPPAGTSVPPGSSYTFSFTITAPAVAGNYNFQWRMLQEVVEWFGDYAPNVSIAVNVPTPPVASNVTIQEPDYCGPGPVPGAFVSWTYTGSTPQTAYRIQIDDDPTFATPNYAMGKVMSSNNSLYASGTGVAGWGPAITWGTTYYARIRVYDGGDVASPWTDGTASWTTPIGPYPSASFTNVPAKPVAGQPVQFTDGSFCAVGGCEQWAWDFGDGGTDVVQNPAHTYALQGAYTVKLDVTDAQAHQCSITKNMNANNAIPFWREVLPW